MELFLVYALFLAFERESRTNIKECCDCLLVFLNLSTLSVVARMFRLSGDIPHSTLEYGL